MSVAGFVPGVNGRYTVVTHSDVSPGPLLGRLVAREIVEGDVDARLEVFCPGRDMPAAS